MDCVYLERSIHCTLHLITSFTIIGTCFMYRQISAITDTYTRSRISLGFTFISTLELLPKYSLPSQRQTSEKKKKINQTNSDCRMKSFQITESGHFNSFITMTVNLVDCRRVFILSYFSYRRVDLYYFL